MTTDQLIARTIETEGRESNATIGSVFGLAVGAHADYDPETNSVLFLELDSNSPAAALYVGTIGETEDRFYDAPGVDEAYANWNEENQQDFGAFLSALGLDYDSVRIGDDSYYFAPGGYNEVVRRAEDLAH